MNPDPHQPPTRPHDTPPGGKGPANLPPGPQPPFSHFPPHLQPPDPRSNKWKFRLLFLALLAIPIGACTSYLAPRQIGAWHLAEARKARADSDKDRSYEKMTEALRWLPDEPAVYLQRAAWRLEDGKHEAALKDAKEAEDRSGENIPVLTTKAQILQHLGRHAEAISIWKNIDRISKMRGFPERSMALNGLAYARAVGRLDLKQALADAEEALQERPGNPAILDTHGFLLHLNGQNEEAIAEMDDAVKGMELEFEQIQASDSPRYRRRQMAFTGGVDLSGINKPEAGVAVVRYHRALVLKALGREEDAKKDLDRARELIGREPDDQLF